MFFIEVEFKTVDIRAIDFERYDLLVPERFNEMVAKRRCEYLAGRIAAKKAIEQLGPAGQITQGDKGCPIWPQGLVGSISHIDGRAVACTASTVNFSALGIDMEFILNDSSARQLSSHFLNKSELTGFDLLPFNQFVTLIFSAKESIYKALFPSIGRFFGFDAVSLITLDYGCATFELQQTLSDHWLKGDKVNVKYTFNNKQIYTLVSIQTEV